jgi:hypothetical protein
MADEIKPIFDKLHGRVDTIRAEILARPVESVADIVDRLVVLGDQLDPSTEIDPARCWQALAPVLIACGVNPGECGGSPDRFADVYAEEV